LIRHRRKISKSAILALPTPEEMSMTRTVALTVPDLAAAIVRRAVGRPRILVGIDGPGASGKTTLAGQLAAMLAGSAVVHVDDFYLPSADRDRRAGQVGALFDLPRLATQVVEPAAAGRELRYQRYDWDTDSLADWLGAPAEVPVIVEGVYCLNQAIRDAYTFTVFCHANPQVRLRRGLERDGHDASARWLDEWMPAEDRYLAAEGPDAFADLVLDSSLGERSAPIRYTICRWSEATR
jgi:uridine kinase